VRGEDHRPPGALGSANGLIIDLRAWGGTEADT